MKDYTMQTSQIQRNYLCAICWSELTLQEDGEPVCAKYGTEHYGYASRLYVQRRRQEDHLDYFNAHWNLSPVLNTNTKSVDELLKELGF